jgi:hypothetical protein
MVDDAKNWNNHDKHAFVNRLIGEGIIDPDYKKRKFEIMFNDCTGHDQKWYTVNSVLSRLNNVLGRGGKSKNRRHRRRKTQSRNQRKTRRSRK